MAKQAERGRPREDAGAVRVHRAGDDKDPDWEGVQGLPAALRRETQKAVFTVNKAQGVFRDPGDTVSSGRDKLHQHLDASAEQVRPVHGETDSAAKEVQDILLVRFGTGIHVPVTKRAPDG